MLAGVKATNVALLADAEQSPPAIHWKGDGVLINGPEQAHDAIVTVVDV